MKRLGPFRDISLRFKLLIVIGITSLVGLGIIITGIALAELASFEPHILQEAQTTSRLLQLNIRSALRDANANTTREHLSVLAVLPSVRLACAYTADQRLLASFRQQQPANNDLCPAQPPASRAFEHDVLRLLEPVTLDGQSVGYLFTRHDLPPLWQRLSVYLWVVLVLIALLIATSLCLLLVLQRYISRPILQLAAVLREISQCQDYSLRVVESHNDEIGWLAGALNRMLATIESHAREIRENHDLLHAIIESAPACIYVKDTTGRYLLANSRYSQAVKAQGDLLGCTDAMLFPPALAAQLRSEDQQALAGKLVEREIDRDEANGRRSYLSRCFPLVDEVGKVFALCGIETDISERKHAESEIRKLVQTVEQSPVAVALIDVEGTIDYLNPKFIEMAGLTIDDVPAGCRLSEIKPTLAPHLNSPGFLTEVMGGLIWRAELHSETQSGDSCWEAVSVSAVRDSRGKVSHFIVLGEDITLRKEYEAELLRQASFDALTGLPNRTLAVDRLNQALALAERSGSHVAVMFLDLDNFKQINDTLGHDAGDILLRAAARRFAYCMRQGHTVGRFGGDEFILVIPDVADATQAEAVARRLLQACAQSFDVLGQSIFVSASIGIALYPDDGDNAESLLKNADVAMYKSKHGGRNTMHFFEAEMNHASHRRLELESYLRTAIENDELCVYYQPMISLKTGLPIGAEALLRWNNPSLGSIRPDEFIPLAEDNGLIVAIGEWVLRESCRELAVWRKRFNQDFHVAVNISSRQLRGKSFLPLIRNVLAEHLLPTEALELEMTERLLLSDAEDTKQLLADLSGMNIRLSIDDFGTGYSALGYLKTFTFNVLKIDKSFVCNSPTDKSDSALSTAIIGMGHGMGMTIVAEGVETIEQLEFLRGQGCDIAQGFYFSRPLTAAAFRNYLARVDFPALAS